MLTYFFGHKIFQVGNKVDKKKPPAKKADGCMLHLFHLELICYIKMENIN